MSKSRKILLGIISFLPIILLVVYLVIFFSFFITMFRHTRQEDVLPGMMMEHIAWIVGVALLLGFISLGLKVYFIIHAVNNMDIDSTERIIWILVFVFAGMIGFPVYWYMRIWRPQLPLQ